MSAQAFLLAAGFGTRLRPLTQDCPKPLVPVCGVPMLDYALALLRKNGIHSAVVNAHWCAPRIQQWADRHLERSPELRLHVSMELPEILGTGGGLKAVQEQLDERFVIVNGDILCDVDLRGLLAGLDTHSAVMALRVLGPAETYGVVAQDAEGKVVDLVGLAQTEPLEPVDRSQHFTGVHALRREVLDRVPERFACIVRTAYTELVREGRVGGVPHTGTWFDVGTPQAYLEANLQALRGTLALPLDPHAQAALYLSEGSRLERDGSILVGPLWVGESVTIAPGSVVGPEVILGHGASVQQGAKLTRTVVWEGCSVPAESALDRCIVYDGGTLELEPSP